MWAASCWTCPAIPFASSPFRTSCSDAPEEILRDYNRRADMENRIAELKHDLGADGFCLQEFYATEATFQAILLLFNLLSFSVPLVCPVCREPATLRTQVFTCGAILGRAGRRLVLQLSQSWVDPARTRNPLIDRILSWEIPTSPKLQSAVST